MGEASAVEQGGPVKKDDEFVAAEAGGEWFFSGEKVR